MNYGNIDTPHILLYNVYADGQYSKWIIYQTPDSSLCSINPCKYFRIAFENPGFPPEMCFGVGGV